MVIAPLVIEQRYSAREAAFARWTSAAVWIRQTSGRAVICGHFLRRAPCCNGNRAGGPAHSRNGSRRDANQVFVLTGDGARCAITLQQPRSLRLAQNGPAPTSCGASR